MINLKLLVFFAGLGVGISSHHHFYRKDYTFIEEFDAFYKLHWDPTGKSWTSAFMACDDEGAKLFYPKKAGEWNVAKKLASTLPISPNTTEIFLGIHDEFGLGEYITVDGHPTPAPMGGEEIIADGQHCVLMDVETGTFRVDSCVQEPDNLENIRPFICKKVDDKACPTIDSGYVYAKETNKCYKVNNNKPKVWHEAIHTCFMEGGMLAVVESSSEAEIVRKMIFGGQLYFTGFRRVFSDSFFYTVKGQKLGEGNYEKWYDRENEDHSACGVLYDYSNSLFLKSNECMTPLPYVCEMEAKAI